MTRRAYSSGERQRAVDAGRDRIIEAAKEVLHLDDVRAFSLEAVARAAGVTRMTVYNQFGSRAGLLEEVFHLMVERDAFSKMPIVFEQKDVQSALDAFIDILGQFYSDNRSVLASLSAVAGQDPDLDQALALRNRRRRQGIQKTLERFEAEKTSPLPAGELANTIDVLLNFKTFDALAGPGRSPAEVVPIVKQLVRGVFREPSKPAPRRKSSASRSK
jgi:AcrR family transcriptional regulator